jgi:hypothetical protein
MKFMEIIISPVKAINSSRKRKSEDTLKILIAVSFIFGLASSIAVVPNSTSVYILTTGVLSFLVIFAGLIILGYVVSVSTNILGGKGSYYEGFTAVTYAMAAPSIGVLISAVVSFIPYFGVFASLLVLLVTIAVGISTLFRGIKELFKTDMIITLIVVIVVSLSLLFAYTSLIRYSSLLTLGI